MARTLALVPWIAFWSLAAAAPARAQGPAVQGELAQQLDDYLERCVPFGFSGSVLVAKDGAVILRKGYGVADERTGARCEPGTRFDIGSLTKQLTAALVLDLEQDGVLKVTDTLERFLPDVPEDKRGIQLHHLLTHTAGIPRGLPQVGSELHERDALVRAVLAAPLVAKPGKKHVYSNVGYDLLAAIVELAAQRPFEELMRERLFAPCGMESTGFRQEATPDAARIARGRLGKEPPPAGSLNEASWRDDSPWDPTLATEGWYSWGLRGAGGVLTTVDDLWRWHEALQGDEVLGKAARKKLFTPFLGDYAYGWYVTKNDAGNPHVEHGGSTGNGFHAKLSWFPKERVFVTVLGNCDVVPWVSMGVYGRALGEEQDAPPATVALDEGELEMLEGLYDGPKGLRMRLGRLEGELVLEALSPEAFELLAGAQQGKAQRELAERSRELLAALAEDDVAGFRAAELPQRPLHFMDGWWGRLKAHHGPLERATVLGASGERGGSPTVLAVLEFERGSELFKLQWSGAHLGGVNIGGPYPNRLRLAPESPARLVAYDLIAGEVRARAQRPERGPPDALDVTVGERTAHLRRSGR